MTWLTWFLVGALVGLGVWGLLLLVERAFGRAVARVALLLFFLAFAVTLLAIHLGRGEVVWAIMYALLGAWFVAGIVVVVVDERKRKQQ